MFINIIADEIHRNWIEEWIEVFVVLLFDRILLYTLPSDYEGKWHSEHCQLLLTLERLSPFIKKSFCLHLTFGYFSFTYRDRINRFLRVINLFPVLHQKAFLPGPYFRIFVI